MHTSLNRVFRLIWSPRLNAWCVAPETARSKGKSRSSGQTPSTCRGSAPLKLLSVLLLFGANAAWAELPQGGKVSAGDGSLSYQGNQLNVQQNSDRMAVDWQSFSIGKDNKVVFNQPGADSIALNRVLGSDVSRIQGAIKANGQVFLLTPNGVLFSPTAQVNTGGLVASTLELSNEDFMAGNFQFEGVSTAAVTNQGEINVAEGGTIALIAATIVNEGSLTANAGNVLMGAGRKVTLDMGGPVKLRVDEGALNTLIEQGGAIRADGGKVLLTARAAGKLATSVINHTGITQAQTLATGEKGEIVLLGDMQQGQVQVAGTLDASAPAVDGKGGDGGFIETSAAKVKIDKDVQVTTLAKGGDTGEWLIDPTDFTISAGSEAPSESGIGADTLSTNLEENNVTLATVEDGTEAGDMYVNGAVSWDAGTTLSLRAHNDIHINEAITGTNGGLALNAGGAISADGAVNVGTFNLQSGDWTQLGGTLPSFSTDDFQLDTANASFLRATAGDGSEGNAYRIFDLYGLQGIASRSLLGSHFVLDNDIDASGTANWNGGAGFVPIGTESNTFTGDFDGMNHAIDGLTINRTNTDYVGLFGRTSGSHIRDVDLLNASVSGRIYVGGLAGGASSDSSISDSSVQGDIYGQQTVGGLVGEIIGDIERSHSSGTVEIRNYGVGGLAGRLYNGSINDSYSTASVTGNGIVGGLVGELNGQISRSYATGDVVAAQYGAGLVGGVYAGNIRNSYATGSVQGKNYNGGLVGALYTDGGIIDSYSTGRVQGDHYTGGLVGWNRGGTVNQSYWNTETSGQNNAAGDGSNAGITGLTTAQMFDAANFTGFDFADIWANADDQTTPYLRALAGNRVFNKNDLPAGTIDATNRPALYTVIQNVEQLQAMRDNLTLNYLLGNHIDASATAGWNSGAGFSPIGNSGNNYSGTFDGLGHLISDLFINGSSGSDIHVGLFGSTNNAALRNVGLENVNITGLSTNATAFVGGLIGQGVDTLVERSYVSGNVRGNSSSLNTLDPTYVGGLAGLFSGIIQDTYTTGNVSGFARGLHVDINVGGMVGYLVGLLKHSYTEAAVSGSTGPMGYVHKGSLVGRTDSATLEQNYWNTATSGTALSVGRGSTAGTTGLAGNEMSASANFADWDLSTEGGVNTVWRIYEGNSSPLLRIFLTPLHIDTDTHSYYTGSEQVGVWTSTEPYTASLVMGAVSGSGTNAGTYTIDASGLYSNQQGYDLITTDGTLVIERAPLDVQVSDANKVYDGQAWSGGSDVSYNGFVGSDDASVLGGSIVWGGTAQGAVNAGEYTLTASGLSSANYEIHFNDGTLTIGKANLNVQVSDASKVYDGQAWSGGNGVSYEGFVGGEDASVLGGSLQWGGDAQGAVNAGDYTLSASGLTSDNYAINYLDGTLSISKALLDVIIGVQDAFKVYDGEAWSGGNGVTIEGLADGDTLADLNGSLVWGGTAQGAVNAGEYSLTASGLSSPNYEIQFDNGTLTISKADLQINVVDAAKVYDAQAWSGGNGVSYEGFVSGEDASVLGGSLQWGGSAQSAVNAGDYTLSVSGLSSNNYNLNYQDGALSIDKAGLTVNVQDAAKTYDGQAWSGGNGVSYDGFVGGESTDALGGELLWGGLAQGAVNAGDYTLTVSGLSADNYSIAYVDGTLTVDKADLTITANDAQWVQDGSAWAGGNGVTYSGFVAGDDASQLDGTLEWGGTAQGARDPGNYTLAASGLSADNYRLNYVDGQLQIISPMEAAGLPYRRAVQHGQRLATQSAGNVRPEYVHSELKVVGSGIYIP